MLSRSVLSTFLAVAAVGAISALAVFTPGLSGKAEAQNLMSAPACQCSPATAIHELSTKVAHCICGGMACVISEGKNTNRMQCVSGR